MEVDHRQVFVWAFYLLVNRTDYPRQTSVTSNSKIASLKKKEKKNPTNFLTILGRNRLSTQNKAYICVCLFQCVEHSWWYFLTVEREIIAWDVKFYNPMGTGILYLALLSLFH